MNKKLLEYTGEKSTDEFVKMFVYVMSLKRFEIIKKWACIIYLYIYIYTYYLLSGNGVERKEWRAVAEPSDRLV